MFQILSRFFLEHMPKGTKMPEDVDEMMRFSHTMFKTATEQALKDGYSRFIVILDALNQMDDDSMWLYNLKVHKCTGLQIRVPI